MFTVGTLLLARARIDDVRLRFRDLVGELSPELYDLALNALRNSGGSWIVIEKKCGSARNRVGRWHIYVQMHS